MIFKPEENENAAFSFAYGQNKNILKRSFLANLFEYISYWQLRNRKHALRLPIEKMSGCLSEREML